MEPKLKAASLIIDYIYILQKGKPVHISRAKKCALLACETVLNTLNKNSEKELYDYWKEVKEHLENY